MKNFKCKAMIAGSALAASFTPLAPALAHCPLCTAGAGLVAVGAYWLGVNGAAIGVVLGAFAVALGLWIARLIKKKYFFWQDNAVGLLSWGTTILPLQGLFSDYASVYINWSGYYGSLFNRTYGFNMFIVGSVIGGAVMYLSPYVSKAITNRRGRSVPFQKILVAFVWLVLMAVVAQFTM